MASDVDPRFRPTLWPGTPVPAPALEPVEGVQVDGDFIVWHGSSLHRQPAKVSLPEDFYLRELRELDPGDMATVATWMSTYGLFCRAGEELDLVNWTLEAEAEVNALGKREHPQRGGWSMHRDLVSIHVQEAQEAVATWLACQREGGLDALIEPDITEENLAQVRESDPAVRDLDDLRELEEWFRLGQLKNSLNAALSSFGVGIGSLGDRRPTIYSVAFLQMYNHIAENAVIRQCASETCRRAFVRQRGRAAYGQNRTSGIKYCTRECARAQAQREHRRRRKAATELTAAAARPEAKEGRA
ncbi:hypothetical protein [Streptomyces sp. NPDC018059]|uniref:hypothetical protein n=1 Tax=Streptomyces sp. NPDC018059 TaxID=3365041 RepID=UPI003795D92D